MNIRRRIALFIVLLFLPLFSIWVFQSKYVELQGRVFGTTYIIKAYVPKWVTRKRLQIEFQSEFSRLDSIFSTWNSDSELSRFNTSTDTTPVIISSDLSLVLEHALKLNDRSSGFFDPTVKPLLDLWGFGKNDQFFKVPSQASIDSSLRYVGMNHLSLSNLSLRKHHPKVQLELSSLAKGYAVDQIAHILDSHSARRYMVEIGGEIKVFSDNSEKPWIIGVTDPSSVNSLSSNLFATVSLYEGAFASSGDYRQFFEKNGKRYSHIINPKTGLPILNNLASVSVYAPSCIQADSLATMLMVIGLNRGLGIVESLPGVEGLFILREPDGNFKTYASSGMSQIGYSPLK